jgi:hypothetical protein
MVILIKLFSSIWILIGIIKLILIATTISDIFGNQIIILSDITITILYYIIPGIVVYTMGHIIDRI